MQGFQVQHALSMQDVLEQLLLQHCNQSCIDNLLRPTADALLLTPSPECKVMGAKHDGLA